MNPFKGANMLTGDRAPMFGRTIETLAERAEAAVARWLPDTTVGFDPAEQVMIPDLARPDTDLAIIKSDYHLTHGVIATELGLAMTMVATLCGGVGQPPPEELRPLSRLETGVYDLILTPVLNLATDLFMVGKSELGQHVSNATALPDSTPEIGVAIPLKLTMGTVEGRVTLAFTAGQLQAYLEDTDRKIAGRLATTGSRSRNEVIRAVRPVPVDLIVGFDPVAVPAGQLAGLGVGDVLRTRQLVSKSLVARVGGQRVFRVRAAQRGQRLVAEITDHIDQNG